MFFPKLRGDRLFIAATRTIPNLPAKGNLPPPLDNFRKFCKMTIFFNKEASNMVTRNLVRNMYGLGGARQARRRALIQESERRRAEEFSFSPFGDCSHNDIKKEDSQPVHAEK